MTKFRNTRRTFLKKVAAATAIPAITATTVEAAHHESANDPKHLYNVDVLIVGGGPAGIGAAMAAAGTGVNTLIIENHAFFGGVASFCLGMNINQMRPGGQPRSKYHELLIEKLQLHGSLAVQLRGHSIRCNVEYLKVAVLDCLEQMGCKYLLHTRAVDTIVRDNRIVGVVAATKRGLAKIKAKAVVDCTGDADICHFAGAETMFDPDNSPMTLALNITNFDMSKLKQSDFKAAIRTARKQNKYPLVPRNCLVQTFPSSNTVMINHNGTRALGPVDATDPEQLTIAEAFSRRQAVQMVAAFREFGPEYLKNAELITAGPQLGIRESRRLKGQYIITEQDAVTGKQFNDVVAWRSGAIDVGGGVYDAKMKVHDVPYRAIVPVKVDGLLAAGRCLSTTHIAHSAGKSMGNCMATGHAAGLAASLSAKKVCNPRELNIKTLQAALTKDGVDLERAAKST
jgi:ribulose 1,5-bisphosphate synthetase/thiazole synthase